MDDTSVSLTQGGSALPWLLLVYQLPPKPDYLRVKIRRRLQRLGAVALKSAAYLLPNRDESLEDFQWLRAEISADGGEASVCAIALIEGMSDGDVVEMFRRARDEEYAALAQQAAELGTRATAADVDRLRRGLSEIVSRDFFSASGRPQAEEVVRELGARFAPQERSIDLESAERAPPFPRGAVWVTREAVHIDRMASAWLIKRFIDPEGRFKFVAPQGYRPTPGELRFDMFEGEFTHEGDRCTFETLLARFGLLDPALVAIAEVVHDIDYKDSKFRREEAPGIATLVRGIARMQSDDQAKLEAAATVFDGLYANFRADPN